jgi:hypothetical protein
MELLKAVPAKGPMAMRSVTWLPRRTVKLSDAGCSEKSGKTVVSKLAVIKPSELIVRLHALDPVQAVLQPENEDPEAGE